MSKLPQTRIKGLALRAKGFLRFLSALNTYPFALSPSQKGFAPVALVVLLLFGIAAGTLLVKEGTNLIPFAAVGSDCRLANVKNFKGETVESIAYNKGGFVCDFLNRAQQYDCVDEGLKINRQPWFDPICNALDKGITGGSERCEGTTAIHVDGSKTDCASFNMGCQVGDGFKADSNQIKYAQSQDSRVLGIATSWEDRPKYAYCKGGSCNNNTLYTYREDRYITEECGNKTCTVKRHWEQEFGPGWNPFLNDPTSASCVEAAAAQPPPAAAPAAGDPKAGACSQEQIDNCKNTEKKTGGCYKDSRGTPVCLYGEDQSCPSEIKCFSGSKGCEIVRGEIRCIYPDNVALGAGKCDASEGNLAQCRVIERTNAKGEKKKISSFVQSCNDGWKNFCRVLFNKGCVNKPEPDGVPECEGNPTAVTAPPPAQQPAPQQPAPAAPRPQGNTGAPPAPAQPRPASGNTQPGQDLSSTVTPTASCSESDLQHCKRNSDKHGLPANSGTCYQIGSYPKCQYSDQAQNCGSDDNVCDGHGGCVLDRIQLDDKTFVKYSRCADAPPIGGAQNQARNTPQTGNTTVTVATGCEEFKEGNDLSIPCFKIGVFSPEDLEATEAHARLASERYKQFTEILDMVKGKISADIEKAARDKITAAEAAAQACLAGQK